MAFTVWQRSIVNESGDVIANAEVEVFDAGASSKPQIYQDPAGSTSQTNPFNANAGGFARFYVAGGRYDIAVNGSLLWEDVALGNVRGRDVGTGPDDVPDVASFAVTEAGVVPEMIGQGAIVDIIENSNGTAVRWESGVQVCWREVTVDWETLDNQRFDVAAIFDIRSVASFSADSGSAFDYNEAIASVAVKQRGADSAEVELQVTKTSGVFSNPGMILAWGFYK